MASATSFSLSRDGVDEFIGRHRLLPGTDPAAPAGDLQPPGARAPAGVIAMNGMIEADIYGNVNSTHVWAARIMNGIGGAGDFARNAFTRSSCRRRRPRGARSRRSCRWSATWTTPSTTYTSWSPSRAWPICAGCSQAAGPADHRALRAPVYRDRCRTTSTAPSRRPYGKHTPHLLDEALSWHQRFSTGDMRPELQDGAPSVKATL